MLLIMIYLNGIFNDIMIKNNDSDKTVARDCQSDCHCNDNRNEDGHNWD